MRLDWRQIAEALVDCELARRRHCRSRGFRANCADMLIPTMSGKENAGAARVKATRITTQQGHRLEAGRAREHTHRMVGMRT